MIEERPKTPYGFDTETHPICADAIAPRMAAAGLGMVDPEGEAPPVGRIYSRASFDGASFAALLDGIFLAPAGEVPIVCQFAAFDLSVAMVESPGLITAIWDKIYRGEVYCTKIREKLLDLADFGSMEYRPLPDGSSQPIDYSLAGLEKKYLSIDRSDQKNGEDAWRQNYSLLEYEPIPSWPSEAAQYLVDDCVNPVKIWLLQEQRRSSLWSAIGRDPLAVQGFRVAADFALLLETIEGLSVDDEEVRRIRAEFEAMVSPEQQEVLIKSGVLTPAAPPRKHAKGAKDHAPECDRKKGCGCPVKMTAGKPEKINRQILADFVVSVCTELGVEVKKTDPSDKFPEGQVATDSDTLGQIAHADPVLTAYLTRQSTLNILNKELPAMERVDIVDGQEVRSIAEKVHVSFDSLKATGRTSSRLSKLYPSIQGQNVNPKARGCIVAPPGYLLFSIDYGAMELVSFGTINQRLFGQSVLADMLREGLDPHAYLGARLAYEFDEGFRGAVNEECGGLPDPRVLYDLFSFCKDHPKASKIFKHYRKFAKPTGLGYPGGLGAETFVAYARATYGVEVDRDTAEQLKEIWKSTFPETRQFFEYINNSLLDPRHPFREIEQEDGRVKKMGGYRYVSPLGMIRSNCDYCAACNGVGLQTPSAEAALNGVIACKRAETDPSLGEIVGLVGVDGRPLLRSANFVHDENIGIVRGVVRDGLTYPGEVHPGVTTEMLVRRVADIMVGSFNAVLPEVPIKAEPVLMRRWAKEAEPVYASDGSLQVWAPKDTGRSETYQHGKVEQPEEDRVAAA